MPKLIDYPRTTYAGAWELAEVVDDTGGKCAIETAARKLNRKVSGSFKAIIGSAVKFGLMTSKRELLSTTTLFKRIKHAYDKKEELLFHREAFLTPPLFTQLCRKFRSRELPVQMLDVMLIREFGVEEINAQGVAKAFVEGCRMVGLLDERNIVADIDALAAQQGPRRELASPPPATTAYRTVQQETPPIQNPHASELNSAVQTPSTLPFLEEQSPPATHLGPSSDAIASLFGLLPPLATAANPSEPSSDSLPPPAEPTNKSILPVLQGTEIARQPYNEAVAPHQAPTADADYQLQVSGPGVNTSISITEEADITIAFALLEKIRRQLRARG